MEPQSIVYVSKTVTPGIYKIGCTRNLRKRYQSARSRDEIVLTIAHEDCLQLESQIHELFASVRQSYPSELFRLGIGEMAILTAASTADDPIEFIKAQPRSGNAYAQCGQCEFRWLPRVPNPKACPKCKRYDWSGK